MLLHKQQVAFAVHWPTNCSCHLDFGNSNQNAFFVLLSFCWIEEESVKSVDNKSGFNLFLESGYFCISHSLEFALLETTLRSIHQIDDQQPNNNWIHRTILSRCSSNCCMHSIQSLLAIPILRTNNNNNNDIVQCGRPLTDSNQATAFCKHWQTTKHTQDLQEAKRCRWTV